MLTSEKVRNISPDPFCRGCADEVAKYERVARAAKDLVHPDHPEYDWPSGSTEYEARRRRLREALADLGALGG